jgi:lipid A ethanolaminephosphotransferase
LLSYQPGGKLYEILPNYLSRTGVDVTWRTSNWGEPPVHIQKYHKAGKLREMYPEADGRYDGILTAGLKEMIEASDNNKLFIVLHTGTSHGPTYNKKYPAEFEAFTPVCNTVEMSKADPVELMNAYDNTILYTDYLVHNVIEQLRGITDRRSCVLFVSDHGESLGENNLYMHGVPMSMAPKEQIEIPFIVWTSDKTPVKPLEKVGQYHVFHSVLDFLGIESPIFNEELNIFE